MSFQDTLVSIAIKGSLLASTFGWRHGRKEGQDRVWLMPTHLALDFMEMFTSMMMRNGHFHPQVG